MELTSKGWRITSLRSDCMQGDFTRMELFVKYYDSLYVLLKFISPDSIKALDAELENLASSNNSSLNSSLYNSPNDNSPEIKEFSVRLI